MQDFARHVFRRDALHPVRVDALCQLGGSADESGAAAQQFREEKNDAVTQQFRLLVAVHHHLPHVVGVAAQLQLPVLDVPTNAAETRPAASPLFLHQRKAGVHRAADGGGAGDAVEHIVRLFFPQMVDEQDGDAMGVGQPFQRGQVAVVIGVGVVKARVADHLKRIDNDQYCVQVLRQKLPELFLQPITQDAALRAEVDVGRRVLRYVEQSVLNTQLGVLQAEIQRGALLHRQSPDGFSLRHGNSQPQGQPGLAHLGRPGQDVQALGDQRVHHKVQRLERFAHQGLAINGF